MFNNGNLFIKPFLHFRIVEGALIGIHCFFILDYEKLQAYAYAICLRENDYPIGYIKVDMDESHDFGYGLRKEFWHRGIVTEAGRAVIAQVKKDGLPYITATHDIHNPRSGGVMRQVGMKYQYSYEEQCQPKDLLVTFRMYQLNFDEKDHSVFRKYLIFCTGN